MDADRTDPAIDAGPTILYAVQVVDEDCGSMFCPACGVAPHVSSTSPLSVHSTGLAMDVNLDDYGMDPDDNPGIGVFEYRVWSRWLASERKRVGVVLTNKGCVRRQRRACRRAFKRLSAMRRQGRKTDA